MTEQCAIGLRGGAPAESRTAKLHGSENKKSIMQPCVSTLGRSSRLGSDTPHETQERWGVAYAPEIESTGQDRLQWTAMGW